MCGFSLLSHKLSALFCNFTQHIYELRVHALSEDGNLPQMEFHLTEYHLMILRTENVT